MVELSGAAAVPVMKEDEPPRLYPTRITSDSERAGRSSGSEPAIEVRPARSWFGHPRTGEAADQHQVSLPMNRPQH